MSTQNSAASSAPFVPRLASATIGAVSPPPRLATYILCYQDDRRGLEKRVHFEAVSPAVALDIARGEAGGRWALLLCDGEVVCRLEREAVGLGEYWLITGSAPAQRPDILTQ